MSTKSAPPATINSIQKTQRKKFLELSNELSVLGYAFSFTRLFKGISRLVRSDVGEEMVVELLRTCIAGRVDADITVAKRTVKDQLTEILTDNGVTKIVEQDPFGNARVMDWYESRTPARFNKYKAIELAPKFKIAPDVASKWLEASYEEGQPYSALRIQDVKKKKGEEGGEEE